MEEKKEEFKRTYNEEFIKILVEGRINLLIIHCYHLRKIRGNVDCSSYNIILNALKTYKRSLIKSIKQKKNISYQNIEETLKELERLYG